MKVILQQEAEYELDLNKTTSIPLPVFLNMVGEAKCDKVSEPARPAVRLFKSIDEFKKEYAVNGGSYSEGADVQVLNNGQICMFRRPFPEKPTDGGETDDKAAETTDGATSTEENKGE